MSKHTPEPWYFDYDYTGSKASDHLNGGWFTAKCLGPDRIENARRIVACVNACAGLETEHLENQTMLGETLVKRFNLLKSEAAELTKQRYELLYQLEEMTAIVRQNTYPQPDKPNSTWGSLVEAEAVINKIKGGAA